MLISHLGRKVKAISRYGGSGLLARKAFNYIGKACEQWKFFSRARSLSELRLQQEPILLVLDHIHGGGANAYRRQRVDAWLKQQGTPVILWQYLPIATAFLISVYTSDSKVTYYKTRSFAAIKQKLKDKNISHILCNELIGWPDCFSVMKYLASIKKENLEIFFHDYFSICPSYQLLDSNMNFCEIPQDINKCAACLPDNLNALKHAGTDIKVWREHWQHWLIAADLLRAPDASVVQYFSRAYSSQIVKKIDVAPHQPLAPQWTKISYPEHPLHIGVIGDITSYAKGAFLVKELIGLLETIEIDWNLTIVGRFELKLRSDKVRITGEYEHAELPNLIETYGINVGFVPSVCPETFSYTAQEIIQLGLPLVCLNMGAQALKAEKYEKGRVATTRDAQGCLEAILAVYRNVT